MRLKELFTVPAGEKITEKMMQRILVSSICSILLCMSCLVSTTWALFTASIENTGNVIQIASLESNLIIRQGGEEIAPSEDGSYTLSPGKIYTLNISAITDSTSDTQNLYAILFDNGVSFGYVTMDLESTVTTFTDAQNKHYTAEVTIRVEKECKFSWDISWLKPGSDESNEITDYMMPQNIHISFDDVSYCFKNLKNETYTSLYQEPLFGWLKELHDAYGAKFSLYVYYNDIKDVPSTYAEEFAAASDWLKIGLHADHSGNSSGFATYDEGKAAWDTFVSYVKTITGTTDSIDRMPRLHYFAGSKAALQGMKDAECGALGFLAADDSRNSYYFDSTTSSNLYNTDHITDHNNGLVFLTTDMRGDWFLSNFSSSNNYRQPMYGTVYEEMQDRYSSDAYDEMLEWCIFFSHEWQFYDGTTLGEGLKWTEDACKFAFENGIAFGYPQDYTFGQTEYDIPVDDGTTAVFDGVTLSVVDDFSKVQFINGYTINGSGLQYEAKAARAISKTEVLKVSDSMRELSLDLTKLSIKDNLYYTVYEFSDRPLNSTTFKTGGGSWTQDDVSLADTTQYIIIIFKNETGDDFTEADLALLNQCVSFGGNTDSDSTDSDTGVDMETTTRDGEIVAIVSNLSDISYVNGSFAGGVNSTEATSVTGRAISRDYVLKVNGGETLNIQQNIEGVTLYFAIKEFTDIPLTAAHITSGGQTYQSWLSDTVTIQSDTRYIVIGFKNGDGIVDFSDIELEKLRGCLVISEGI